LGGDGGALTADPGGAEDIAERALLDRLVAVYRDGDRVGDARMAQDVVAAADALHVPALAFEELDELLAGKTSLVKRASPGARSTKRMGEAA
jgi:hypothetical protein